MYKDTDTTVTQQTEPTERDLSHQSVHIFRSNVGYSNSAYQLPPPHGETRLLAVRHARIKTRPWPWVSGTQLSRLVRSFHPRGGRPRAFSTTCFLQAFADKAETRVAANFDRKLLRECLRWRSRCCRDGIDIGNNSTLSRIAVDWLRMEDKHSSYAVATEDIKEER